MDDSAAAAATTTTTMASSSAPAPMTEVLLNRYVPYVDELQEIIRETGELSLGESMESVPDALPNNYSNSQARDRQRQAAMRAEIRRYRTEVEASAFAVLRERKASRPSAVRKVDCASAASTTHDDYDAVSFINYRESLDGVEPRFPDDELGAGAPAVTSMALRVSWPPDYTLRSYPSGGHISSCDEGLLALYVGTYRPGLPSPGFYLVYDTAANSVAVVPPISRVHYMSHGCIGTGAAVLRHGEHHFVLPKDDRISSRKATLFTWCSPGSAQWTENEALLPIPEGFHADMVFAAAGTAICWVDLMAGILICDNINNVATGIAADEPTFRFIPLPEECAMKPDLGYPYGRGQPEQYRSMCCVDRDTFRFASMDGFTQQGRPTGEVTLTTWTLKRPLTTTEWEWVKDEASFCVGDIWNDPVYKDELKLQPLTPSFPVISTLQDGVIYLAVTDYTHNSEHGRLEPVGLYELSVDMRRQRVVSAFKFPSRSEGGPVLHPQILATRISNNSIHVLPTSSIISTV